VIPCPVYHDGTVYVMSGYRGYALMAINLAAASGDITDSEAIVWKDNKDTPYTPSPLLYEDHLYFFRSNSGALTCLDAKTGQAHYTRQQLEGVSGVYSSPVGVKDRVYLVGRKGLMKVIKLGAAYDVLAENVLQDQFSASPAIVGKELFLRGHKYLYCIAQD
jgi:outer membrane protein assembly factor BamB